MLTLEEAARARATDPHPDILDGTCDRWTWRGHGYAIDHLPDTDPWGRPWITQADTITALYGRWQGRRPN